MQIIFWYLVANVTIKLVGDFKKVFNHKQIYSNSEILYNSCGKPQPSHQSASRL